MKARYRTISLPDPLLQEIERIINIEENGYTTPADFIREAVRKQVHLFQDRRPDIFQGENNQ